jgi:ketosteroid isomerase-like protein
LDTRPGATDNESIVREMYEAFNREGVTGTVDYYADELVWHSDPTFPEGGTFDGRGAVVRYMTDMFANWVQVELQVEDVIPSGDQVLTLLTMRNTGRDGIKLDAFWAHLWTVKDGKMIDVRSFLSREPALEAIGALRQRRPSV